MVSKSTKLSKFIILLADGSDTSTQEGARELVRKMRNDDNTTLTVVSIGDGSDVQFLKNIASIGKGRFHLTDKAANLPTIFTEETALAQRSYIVEQSFFPTLGAGGPILSGIAEVPALQGYIASTPKPAAQVILRANESDPLLAAWQYGLGRAIAFTSDATGRWGKNWVQWSDFPKFWAQAVRWTILERGQSTIQASVQQRGDQTVITADVPDARLDEDLKLSATIIDSEGQSREVTLQQAAPGRFEAETYLDQAGAYFVRVRPAITATGEVTGEAASAMQAAETSAGLRAAGTRRNSAGRGGRRCPARLGLSRRRRRVDRALGRVCVECAGGGLARRSVPAAAGAGGALAAVRHRRAARHGQPAQVVRRRRRQARASREPGGQRAHDPADAGQDAGDANAIGHARGLIRADADQRAVTGTLGSFRADAAAPSRGHRLGAAQAPQTAIAGRGRG